MGIVRVGNFSIGWGKGVDRWTKTNGYFGSLNQVLFNGRKAEYEIVEGREYELYDTTAEISIVIGRFASMFANGRFVHKRKNGTVQGEVIEDSALVQLLENPNPTQSGEEWKQESVLHYWLFGNIIQHPVYGIRSINPYPKVINNLPPEYTTITTTGKRYTFTKIEDIVTEYILNNGDSGTTKFKPKEIIHHKRVDPRNPLFGRSVLFSLRMPITGIRSAYGYRIVSHTEKGALGIYGNKTSDAGGHKPLQAEDRLAIEKQYSETHGQFSGQARTRFVDGDVTYTPTGFAIKESMTFEEVTEDTKKIIDALNLNDNIFSKEKSKIQANLKEGLRMAYQDAIIPFSESFCSNLSKGLELPENEWIEMDFSHIPALKEDDKEKAEIIKLKTEAYDKLVTSGWNDKEARKVTGLD
jgi:phage portal protein BeeE